MKKQVMYCFFMCASVIFFSCTKQNTAIEYIEDPSLSKILVKRALVIGVDEHTPILSFRNQDNEFTGYDVEIFEEICRRIDIRPIFYPINWAEKETLLNAGTIDCIISGFSISDERKKQYTLITPYLQNAQILAVLTKNGYRHLSDLRHKRIYIQKASLSKETIEANPLFEGTVEIIEVQSFIDLCAALDNGNADAIAVDLISSYDTLIRKPGYSVIEEPLSAEFYTFAFRKNDKTLARKIENVLKEMDKDQVLSLLSKKWLGTNLSIVNTAF